MKITVLRLINVVVAALLAGTSFGIWVGFNPVNYSPHTYIEQQQNLVTSLNTLMVSLVVGATIITLVSAYLQRKNRFDFITLLIAAFFFASCIFISRFGNYPIQSAMLHWDPNSLPENWTTMRDTWWTMHKIRTISELIALVLVAWTGVRKQ